MSAVMCHDQGMPASHRPRSGDVFLHCSHAPTADRSCVRSARWFTIDGGIAFTRPNGTQGVALHVALCNACAIASDGDPFAADLVGDGVLAADVVFQEPN